jgi:hypothetical protein
MKTLMSVMAMAAAMLVTSAIAECPAHAEKKAAKCESCGCSADAKKADCKCDKCACCKKDGAAAEKKCGCAK